MLQRLLELKTVFDSERPSSRSLPKVEAGTVIVQMDDARFMASHLSHCTLAGQF